MHSSKFLCLLVALTSAPVAAQEIEPARAEQVAEAEIAQAAGNFDRARQILETLLEVARNDPDLMRRLAMVEAGDGRLAVARDHIAAASAHSPNDLDIALARGYILYWSGEFDEAESVAAAIAARDPAYPEFALLEASLARQNDMSGFQLRALAINSGLSNITLRNGASSTWISQSIVAALDVSSRNKLILGAMREARSTIDTRLNARLDHRISNGFIYVAATIVPSPNFQEDWSIATGGELIAAEGLKVVADLRFAEYGTGKVMAVQPGLRIAITRDFDITARAINILDDVQGYRLGASLRFDYQPNNEHSLFAIAASYPDAEANGVQQMRSAAIGFAISIAENITMSSAVSYENRDDSYRRWTGNLGLNFRFGAQ